ANDQNDKPSVQQSRRPNLSSLQIPERSLENALPSSTRIDIPSLGSPASTRSGLPPRPASAKFRTSSKYLLPQRTFKTQNLSQEGEKTVLLIPETPSSGQEKKPFTSRSFSMSKIFSSSTAKRTSSLPVTPVADSGPEYVQNRGLDNHLDFPKTEVQKQITRSFSVPVNVKTRSLRQMDSTRGLMRVISVTPRSMVHNCTSPNGAPATENVNEDAGEDIPEEEAVCRICFIELGEGGETLKLECSCKGELALAHQDCAVKWFSIKGNKTCDICKQDVKNLPVTLLRIQTTQTPRRTSAAVPQQREVARYRQVMNYEYLGNSSYLVSHGRVWQDVPVLVMVSMLAYFCFLEQLLVSDLRSRALAVSLPFSCVLGLLSSMIASTMVSRGYIWAYASFQFAIVILFAHIFYAVLNVNAILSVLLSSFTGFGIAISTNSLLVEYLRWRSNRNLISTQQQQNQGRHQPRLQQHGVTVDDGPISRSGQQETRMENINPQA
ncbi:hypothetical protein IFM89_013994, partial [Coptis chinensis]